jgi:hypothetical protein
MEDAKKNRKTLPMLAKGKKIMINCEEIRQHLHFDVFVQGRARDSLVAINEWMNRLAGE